MGPVICRLLSCVFMISISLAVGAAPSPPWFTRVWQVDDGLPGDNVTGVVQTKDAYLWIGTQTGLARFDGVRMKNISFRGDRPTPIIRAMNCDERDELWLALEGGTVIRWAPGRTKAYTAASGLSRSQPAQVITRGEEAWIAYADGSVCRILGDQVDRFADEHGLPPGGACSMAVDNQGELWLARAGQVGIFDGTNFSARISRPDRFIQIIGSRKGGLWACAGETLLRLNDGSDEEEVAQIEGESALVRPLTMFEDSAGAVWIGTSSVGLFRYDGTRMIKVDTSHGRIQVITEDREGNIWIGTDGGGLNRLRVQVVELHGKEAGIPFDTVRSVCEDAAGTVWMVTQNGNVATYRDGVWENLTATERWPGGQSTCVVSDADGVVNIGTYSRGLYRFKDGVFLDGLRRRDGLAGSSVRSLLVDRQGSLWIAFDGGDTLQKYSKGELSNYALPKDSRAIRAMTEDHAGNIWMANLDAQLLRIEGDKVVEQTHLTSETNRPIRCLVSTEDGSLWIGYSTTGIGRLKDGAFSRVGPEQGLPDGSICSLMPDHLGWMWVGSDHGVFRVRTSELIDVCDERAASIKAVRYGRDAGLPSLQGYYGYSPGAARCRDGRVLLPTHLGLVIAHPDRVKTARLAPPVVIESMLVDGKPLSQSHPSLPAKHHKVEFAFTAPMFFGAEKLVFRYLLEGWDESWIEVEPGSERHAVYSRLPAGDYRFRVMALSSDGTWRDVESSVAFSVQQFIWKSWWFIALCFAASVAATFAAVRVFLVRRLHLKVERLERENALQRERARIAQDMHDDIGARMTQMSLLAELTQQNLGKPDVANQHVSKIATMSRNGIKAIDEIVWAANPRNDTVADLLDYAGQYALDFLQLANVRCRIDFPQVSAKPMLDGHARHGLFLAVKEAVHNIVKHAGATEVWLRAKIDPRALQLSIEDNGCGFETEPDGPLADGLRNMRTRLTELGGKCSIESQPGRGVKIQFELPLQNHD